MRPEIDAALDECLEELRRGLPLESCLERYPEYAASLRPLLETVIRLGRLLAPPIDEQARAAGRERMLAALAQPPPRSRRWLAAALSLDRLRSLAPAWRLATLALVLCLLGGLVAGVASTSALPGEVLYPVKAAAREVRLALTLNPARSAQVAEAIAEEQRREVGAALQADRPARVAFQGPLQAVEGTLWTIGGLPVTLEPGTEIQGKAQVGGHVQVRGWLPGDGRLLAVHLEIGLPPGWPTPTATPSPSDTPTPSPIPSMTAAPEGTPPATATPPPTTTGTASPSDTPRAGETIEPSPTPTATGTPQTQATEEAEETDEPDETEEPEETDESDGASTSEATRSATRPAMSTPGSGPTPSETPEDD